MPPAARLVRLLHTLLPAVLWLGLLWSSVSAADKEVSLSTQSPAVPPSSTREGSTKGKSPDVTAGGLLHSVLAQKARLVSKKGELVPSALPQNLLPLLGRGLSVSSLSGRPSLEHQSGGLLTRVKSPESASESGQGSLPSQPTPTDTHTQLPHTQTNTLEPEAKSTTVGTILDVDSSNETPSPERFRSMMGDGATAKGFVGVR
nr:uncharacterized protein LOC129159248 [Nothobranchius furzeri]